MTENMFAAADDNGTGQSRRPVILAAGLAGALALGASGYFLLLGGSDDTTSAGPIVAKRHAVTKKLPNSSAKKAIKPASSLPQVSSVRLGRDPFKALYIQPAAVVAAPQSGSDAVNGGTPATSTGGTTTTGTPAVVTTYPLKLSRVYGSGKDRTGVFSVEGKTQLAKLGSVFGKTSELKLLSLQQNNKGAWTGTIQVGDSEPFDAALGQTVYVL